MSYPYQRDEPQAVRSDPVPVPRTAPEDETDFRATDDRVRDDGATEEREAEEREAEQRATDEPQTERVVTGEPEAEQRAAHEPEDEQRATDEPQTEQVVTGEPEAEQRAAHEPEDERRTADEPEDERHTTDEPENERHATDDAVIEDRGTFDDPVVVDDGARDHAAETADADVDADVDAGPDGAATAAHEELMPGDVAAEPVAGLIAVDTAERFRDRWRDVQLRFVDDPRGAAEEARTLAEEAADALVAALTATRTDLDAWEATEAADTEQLRVVVRRYRDFIDRLLHR